MTPEQREHAIAQYAAGYDEVARALEGFPPAHLATRAVAGKWSAAEILHHLADSEMTSALRLRRLLVEERPVIWGYDQDQYAARLRYAEREIGPALEAFRGARATTTQLLRSMTEEEWRREGWHTEDGHYTPEKWLEIYSVHAHDHAAQIARLKDTLKSRPASASPEAWW